MTTTTQLPPGQARALDAIVNYWRTEGRSPTIRDLCEMLDISSPNGVVFHLRALRRKGFIEWEESKQARAVWPIGLRDRIRGLVERMY